MDKKLFTKFQYELFDEAKRIVPLADDEKRLMKYNENKYKNYLDKKYKSFKITIELFLAGLCGLKADGKDWENEKLNMLERIEHHKKVLEYDKEERGSNVEETVDLVAKDIVDNYDKYKNQSLFEIMPILVSKYMKTHNDSVEHQAYVLYLNNSLKKYGKYLSTTNLIDLRNI